MSCRRGGVGLGRLHHGLHGDGLPHGHRLLLRPLDQLLLCSVGSVGGATPALADEKGHDCGNDCSGEDDSCDDAADRAPTQALACTQF